MTSRTVNRQLRTLKVTTPTATPQTTPQSTAWDLGACVLERLDIVIPRGHSGLTGIHVDYQNVAIVPFDSPPTFLVGANETIPADVDFELGAPLTIVTYNTDSFAHSHYLRAHINVWLPGDLAAGAPALVVL